MIPQPAISSPQPVRMQNELKLHRKKSKLFLHDQLPGYLLFAPRIMLSYAEGWSTRRPEYLCPEQKMEPSLYASCPLPDSEDSVPHLTVKNIYGASTTVYSQSKRMGEETYFGNLTVLHPNRARSQNNTILLLHNYYCSTTTALC